MESKRIDPDDRRHGAVRYPVMVDAHFVMPNADPDHTVCIGNATLTDVSLRGAGVRVSKGLTGLMRGFAQSKRSCALVCRLPGSGDPTHLPGEIRWLRKDVLVDRQEARLGIVLKGIGNEDRLRLLRFLDRAAPNRGLD